MSKKNKGGHGNDYEVGYGKPPKDHQFKPGQSGNLGGRPTKEKTNVLDSFENIMLTKERVKINGKYEYRSRIELFFMMLADQSLKKTADRKLLIDLMIKMKLEDRFLDIDAE